MVLGRKLGRTGRRLLARATSHSTTPAAAGTGEAAPTTDLGHRPAAICAYSYDGVMRSFEESLGRLRMDRVPLVFIHDPDLHYGEASRGAYRALEQLRAAGSIDAIGVGMSDPEALVRFADSGDYDCFLLGGRYTLLEQPALERLLPLAVERGISILLGGPFNSGVLANPAPGALYDHAAASDKRIDTARRIKAVCDRQGIPVAAAALQFPLAHPAIVSVLVGAGSLTELDEDDALMRQPIPSALWDELRHEGLLRADAPTPS
jgi:D-threo-aldose 1-dehydrogenase